MVVTKEMKEVFSYLHGRSDYVIFGGVASFFQVGVKCSPDVDVMFVSRKALREAQAFLSQQKWKVLEEKSGKYFLYVCMSKGKTTTDFYYSIISSRVFVPRGVKKLYKTSSKNFSLMVLNPESLFINKIQVLAEKDRPLHKTKRDRITLFKLRNRLRANELQQLLQELPLVFWSKGYF